MDNIRELLRADPVTATWLEHLEAAGAPEFAVELPSADELPPILLELTVPHEEIDGLVVLLPSLKQSAGLWWLLERCAHVLVRDMGQIGRPQLFPTLPSEMGVMHRYFYIYVFLAVLPHVQAYHRARSIPDDIARRTLADLGRHMAVYHRIHGEGGLGTAFWLMLHFRGGIYDMGRLQFERATLGDTTGAALQAAGLPYGPGDLRLSVHVPAFSGPITLRACDMAFERAKPFFARYFPEERYEIATCNSWLLDDQLAEYLPAGSNIMQFQRRFEFAVRRPEPDDAGIVRFVFGQNLGALDELPGRSTLERAIIGHLQAGRHWYGAAGWLRL